MPRRKSRAQLLRDLTAYYESLADSVTIDEHGNPVVEPLYTGLLTALSPPELQQLYDAEQIQSQKIGRPRRLPNVRHDIEWLMKEHGCGVLEACRLYDRGASEMLLRRPPKRTRAGKEAAAKALVRRYHREKNG